MADVQQPPALQDFHATQRRGWYATSLTRAAAVRHTFAPKRLSQRALVSRLLVAFLMATALWIYVTGQNNPVAKQQFSLPVAIHNLPQGLAIRSGLAQVQISVSGLQDTLNTARSLSAFVDLHNVSPSSGEATIPIQLQGTRSDLQYTQKPSTLSLVFQRQVSKSVKVTFSAQSSPSVALSEIGSPQISPLLVTVSGPEESVNRVANALVTAPLDQVAPANTTGAEFPITLQLVPQLIDKQGHPITDSSLTITSGTTISVKLRFRELYQIRTMVITPILSAPADGMILGPQAPQPAPQTVVVLGAPQILSVAQTIPTEPIDIHTLTKTSVLKTRLHLPPGMIALSQDANGSLASSQQNPVWHVLVTVSTVETNAVLPAAVHIDHLGKNLAATASTPLASIAVRGSYHNIKKLGSLIAHIDVTGKGPGTYTLPVRIATPEVTQQGLPNPTTIRVVITQQKKTQPKSSSKS